MNLARNLYFWLDDVFHLKCVKKIYPILNRCVIFNTTDKSIHGHPLPLNVPNNIRRQSISVYYYTKNNNELDLEGDSTHSPIWYPNIEDINNSVGTKKLAL